MTKLTVSFLCVLFSLFIIAALGDDECTAASNNNVARMVAQDKVLYVLFEGIDSKPWYTDWGTQWYTILKNYVETTQQTGTVEFLTLNNATDTSVLDLSIYNIIFTYDLSQLADNYTEFYTLMGTWFKSQQREIICDGRMISSVWRSDEDPATRPEYQLIYNFYENLRKRGGGIYVGTDDNSYTEGTNQMMAAMGFGPFTDHIDGTVIPVDIDHPIISYPLLAGFILNGTRVIWDDSTPSNAPFNLQPDGKTILYVLAYHSGNVNSPAISTSIRGSLGFLVSLTGIDCDDIFTLADSPTLTAGLQGGTGPFTYSWSDSLEGTLETSLASISAPVQVGTHVVTLTVTDSTGLVGQAKVRYSVQSGAATPSPSPSNSASPCAPAPAPPCGSTKKCCGGGGRDVEINFIFADMLRE